MGSGTRLQVGAGVLSAACAKSLALHVLAARRIAANPRLLERARVTLRRWLARYGGQAPAALREWSALLDRP